MVKKIIAAVFALFYALLIFVSFSVLHLPPRAIGLVIAAFAVLMFFFRSSDKKAQGFFLVLAIIALAVGFSANMAILKLYPVAVNILMLYAFAFSLSNSEGSIAYRFATLGDRTIKWSARKNAVKRYCAKVTVAWCAFFVFNASASLYTNLFLPIEVWTLYNSLVSYILIVVMFVTEYAVRLAVQKRLRTPVFISSMQKDSREDDAIVAYSGFFSDKKYKYWSDFLKESAALRSALEAINEGKVIVRCGDNWHFAVSLCAVLSAKKAAVVPSNYAEDFIAEIADDDTAVISDDGALSSIVCIDYEETVRCASGVNLSFLPIGKDAKVILYTSGSTGHPKAVYHDLWELEDDNDSLGAYYRKDFQRKIAISSVYANHAFGIVFSIIKPLIHSIPIRRERIEIPEELTIAENAETLFISTPSFLKMVTSEAALIKEKKLKPMQIITAGAPLERSESREISALLGTAPIEIYGSTETGAIATRINKVEGDEWWIPNKSVEFKTDGDGALSVRANGVHGNDWLATSDIVKIREDGRFLLLGRKDSIVKVAEKRVSLVEVARRIKETGLADDAVAVLYDKGKRPVIAAVVVLSSEGKGTLAMMSHAARVKHMRRILFSSLDSVVIPKRWRFVRSIPANKMGKIQMEELLSILDREVESEGF